MFVYNCLTISYILSYVCKTFLYFIIFIVDDRSYYTRNCLPKISLVIMDTMFEFTKNIDPNLRDS